MDDGGEGNIRPRVGHGPLEYHTLDFPVLTKIHKQAITLLVLDFENSYK